MFLISRWLCKLNTFDSFWNIKTTISIKSGRNLAPVIAIILLLVKDCKKFLFKVSWWQTEIFGRDIGDLAVKQTGSLGGVYFIELIKFAFKSVIDRHVTYLIFESDANRRINFVLDIKLLTFLEMARRHKLLKVFFLIGTHIRGSHYLGWDNAALFFTDLSVARNNIIEFGEQLFLAHIIKKRTSCLGQFQSFDKHIYLLFAHFIGAEFRLDVVPRINRILESFEIFLNCIVLSQHIYH
mmetsp:Transcript_9256/g.14002  ORF Transcript_9256/g.14002 Transcript_9256/m.14002 type:complete len:239 (-) Transcript_9256:195-911(-)